ncbi:GIY-YIG nuclease family protein [Roseospirillum parvum]|uniref:GIY-YIG domain-containing protein n=1 Tax=Roseospirillum parvum TaxID=83401 RepID=A0A1G8E6A1_9PROT|nr:GIY-YIG nuclease family protein [Roseospirillum parvum]SDH65374.1 hypothetical protein SAMN05421742_10948 [Roseospirillum parvum]
MQDFSFNDIITRRGYPLKGSKMLRHDKTAVAEWRQSRSSFECFTSYHRGDHWTPYGPKVVYAFQFLPISNGAAIFVGAHKILDTWIVGDGERKPVLWDANCLLKPEPNHYAYDLEVLSVFDDLIERVLIDWGPGVKAWHQWAERRPKPIIELRADAEEAEFPGFAAFQSSIEDVTLMPRTWQAALSNVQGVYLLVCPETGNLYVGSATGERGFMGRWASYATDGHGGNKLLKNRKRVNYAVSILEVASPDMSSEDVLRREAAWKAKLGSRAHGLNAN